jgi:hypothetical protein
MSHDMQKLPLVAVMQQIPAPPALFSINEKNASTFTSSPFDFVAAGLGTIQLLFWNKCLVFFFFSDEWVMDRENI